MQELNKIKGYRKMVGLTQDQMAQELNMSSRSYQTKEQDNGKFTAAELKALVDVLGKHNLNIKIDDLF